MKNEKMKVEKAIEIAQEQAEFSETERQVYFAGDIMKMLGVGRSRCYTYLGEVYEKQEPFRVIKVGKLFRVPKQSFDNWLNGCR